MLFSALLASQGRFQSAPTGDQCSSCCSATRNQPLGLLIATAGLTCLIASPTTSAAVTSKLNSLPYALRLRGPDSTPCAGCCRALTAPIFVSAAFNTRCSLCQQSQVRKQLAGTLQAVFTALRTSSKCCTACKDAASDGRHSSSRV